MTASAHTDPAAPAPRMQLGMVGLGRMGANIVRRLMRDGHTCAGTDVSPDAVAALRHVFERRAVGKVLIQP